MSLREDIERMQKETLPGIPAETLQVMRAATEKLVKSGLAERAKRAGDPAPDFSLPNTRGEQVSLNQQLQKGPVVLSFYRGAWCPYCNLELKALDNAVERIRSLGAELFAISPNTQEKSAQFAAENPFKFDLLCDVGNEVARQFGLVFQLADELRPIYEQFGIDLPAYNGDDRYEIPIPATYIMEPNGTIVHAFVDADYTKRMEPDEIV
ncbi:MAG: AhpC/TSA family protein, partial [Calditrichaeota bacterium]